MNLEELPLFSTLKSADELAKPIQPKHWTVSEITSQIRGILEPSFIQVWVQGEISNYRPAASGHAYFSLKDESACISAASFGWGARQKSLQKNAKASFDLKDGLQVLVRGKISVYPPRGTYQLVVDHIEPLGAGALQLAFEQLKEKLAAQGLFDSKRKRALPKFPTRIAVVSSPSGAAIQDMIHILKRRAPHLRVTLIPAIVQGDSAAEQIIKGLENANRGRLGEIVILARGGGSIEDLWCFNDEKLAHAIAASSLPVISAVGHEIDFTISDFVADLRAPTPSAAAEIVSGFWVDSLGTLRESKQRLFQAVLRDLANRKKLLSHITARVISPRDRLREQAQKCDELSPRLERAFRVRLENRRSFVERLAGKLDALSPLKVLERGYSLVRDQAQAGAVVKSVKQVHSGQRLEITFQDGTLPIEVV